MRQAQQRLLASSHLQVPYNLGGLLQLLVLLRHLLLQLRHLLPHLRRRRAVGAGADEQEGPHCTLRHLAG